MEAERTICTNCCSVDGCKNRTRPLFRYPNPNSHRHLFLQWLYRAHNARYDNLSHDQIFSRGFVCHKHFESSCFRIRTPKRLFPGALPTLNLHPAVQINERGKELPPVGPPSVLAIEYVEDPSKRQLLVEELDIFRDGYLPGTDFEDVLGNFSTMLRGSLFRDPNISSHFFKFESELNNISPDKGVSRENRTEVDSNSISPERDDDNNENQIDGQIVENRNCDKSEKQCIADARIDVLDRPVYQECGVTGTVPGKPRNPEEATQRGKPYFKSLKSFLEGCNLVTEVCRICFQSLEEEEVIKLYDESPQHDPSLIKKMLKLVLPDLDLDIYPNIVICVKCAELLVYSYQLKEKWLFAEENLQKILAKKKGVIDRDADLVIVGTTTRQEKTVSAATVIEHDHDYLKSPLDLNDANAGSLALALVEPSRSKNVSIEKSHSLVGTPDLEFEEASISKTGSIRYGLLTNNNIVSITPDRKKKRKRQPPRSYICEHCGCIYKNNSSFNRHLRKHRSLENYVRSGTVMCETCGLSFSIGRIEQHKKTHLGYKCTLCDRAFNRWTQLYFHRTRRHSPTPLQCHLCGKQVLYTSSLRSHLKCHNPANKNKICHICDKKFFFAHNLRKHLRSHSKEKVYKCGYCERSLKHPYSLQKHIKIYHLNQGQHTCEICNKTYWKKQTLELHRYRVHGGLTSKLESNQGVAEEIRAVDSIQRTLEA